VADPRSPSISERRAARIILMGQAPGRNEPRRPLVGGSTGNRLLDLSGLQTWLRFLKTFETMNVIDYYPGSTGKGDRFPAGEARVAAREKVKMLAGRRVIFVGVAVAEAFGLISPRPFEWLVYAAEGFIAYTPTVAAYHGAMIPHTSGVNQFWNDPENVAAARRFFAETLS
jgi:uracil-DNA glycosylase